MNKLFGKMLYLSMLIITAIIIALVVSFTLIYSNSYEEQVTAQNDKQALYIAQSLYSFLHTAYKTVEDLSFNSDVISMDTQRQTAVFTETILRNDYFELLYAQGMDGMQTGRSTGELGNRKERWWFIQMETEQRPFISKSYYSVGTNMPCTSIFFPIIENSQMIGIMAGDIRLSALHDFVAESADPEAGSWAFILDGDGVVVAHPDSTYQEELYNYLTLTRTVTIKDEHGVPIQDAAGNLTEEQSFHVSDAYKAAISDMIAKNIGNAKFEENGVTTFLSYRPVILDGYSDPWYVLSVRDGDVAMRTRDAVITLLIIISVIVIAAALLVMFITARTLDTRVKMEAMEARHEIEKAQESERVLREFLATVSHELRTPMNTILGITQIQKSNKDLPLEYTEALNDIYNSANILLGIINNILNMANVKTGMPEMKQVDYNNCSLIGEQTADRLRNHIHSNMADAETLQIERVPMPYGKVLVVDDVESNLLVAEGLLSQYQLQIETAESGFEALEIVKSGKSFDVIFMDHMMPDMDGIETVKKLRALGYNGTIVALTANALAGNDEMFLNNGFDGFISKPIYLTQLNDVLNKHIRGKHPGQTQEHSKESAAKPPVFDPLSDKLMKAFCRDAEKALATLRENTVSQPGFDYKRFTITVHAMKSALANINEPELSAKARALEEAGKNNDSGFILKNADEFTGLLKLLIEKLQSTGSEASDNEDKPEDTAFLKAQLKTIIKACEDYDSDTAFAALGELNKKQWKSDTTDKLERIYNALYSDSDFELACSLAKELL